MAGPWGGTRVYTHKSRMSDREIAEVHRLIGMGLTLTVVARRMGISKTTVVRLRDQARVAAAELRG